MTIIYLETSALLQWLFNEPGASNVIDSMNEADLIVTSDLLRIETVRAIKRLHNEKLITAKQRETLLQMFIDNLKGWFRMSIDDSVVMGASNDFPAEPVRSLDAIHLATALEYKKLYPELRMLTTDNSLLKNLKALGLENRQKHEKL